MPVGLKKLIEDIGDRIDTSRYCPDHWHDVEKDGDRIRVAVTPGCAKKSNLVYVFRNKESGHLLIGKTDTLARERLNKYTYTFNTARSEGKKLFPKAVRKEPEKYEWAILKELEGDEDLDDWENAFIIALNTLVPNGFNQVLGRGGGHAVPKKKKTEKGASDPQTPIKSVAEMISQARIYDFYKDGEGYFHADWSPTAKAIGSKIYGVLLEDNVVYIGKTDQQLRKRSYQHFSNSRSDTEKKDLPLYQKLAEAVEGAVALFEKDIDSPERKEGKIRKAFEDEGYTVVNVAPSGGGPSGASRTKRKLNFD